MSSVTFSNATATYFEEVNNWAPSQMIDGVYSGYCAGWITASAFHQPARIGARHGKTDRTEREWLDVQLQSIA